MNAKSQTQFQTLKKRRPKKQSQSSRQRRIRANGASHEEPISIKRRAIDSSLAKKMAQWFEDNKTIEHQWLRIIRRGY